MQYFSDLSGVNLGDTWLTIGSFDGVHLGHQSLIKKLVKEAHANSSRAVVLTFMPHPAVVLRGLSKPFYLTGQEEKRAIMEGLGVDAMVTLEFTLNLAAYTANTFLGMLAQHMKIRKMVVGQGFALGQGRTGDILALEQIGRKLGFTIEVVDPSNNGSVVSSSSLIRTLLEAGDLAGAAGHLGRNYSLEGIVSHGDGRGRQIGFPTANIAISEKRLLPRSGVYACRVTIGDSVFGGVTNIGTRPTFHSGNTAPLVETHLLDFHGDVYGQIIQIEFVKYLREESRFDSAEALIIQICRDILAAKEVLA